MIFFLTRHVLFLMNLHDFLTGYQPYYHLKRLLYLWGKKVPGEMPWGRHLLSIYDPFKYIAWNMYRM